MGGGQPARCKHPSTQDSHLFNRNKLERSLDMLNSSIAYHKNPIVNLSLTEEDRAKVALTGAIPADIERILSDD